MYGHLGTNTKEEIIISQPIVALLEHGEEKWDKNDKTLPTLRNTSERLSHNSKVKKIYKTHTEGLI